MKRLLLPFICTLVFVSAAAAKDAARVWEAPLVIPTYELNPPNPYPALLDSQRRKWRPVYPYPFLDSLGSEKTNKSWKAVYLENEYLKVTVLPELGGHVYKIFDKTLNRDIIYTNPVMKYAMVALRGAWVSGGIEWNFPDGHTLTTVAPIDYVMRTEADGSAAVAVGDTERVQGMQWQVVLRLRPGTRVLESEVTLNNRREVPGRYWYWSTAGAPAAPDLRFNYPMREAYPHAFWPVFKFPLEKGVDIGKFSEVPNFLSLFARDSKRDYFGIYYEQSDWGVVHVADHRELPGKKTWTWGTDDNGDIWIDKLTDGGGQYVEFQGGRFETQMEHQFIAPHRVEHFFEYWYGVNRMGGAWNEATRDAALRIDLQERRANISIAANQRFAQVELTVANGEKQIHAARVDLDPATIYTTAIEVPASRQPLTVTLKSADGRVLLQYRTDSPVDNNPDFKPATRPIPDPTNPASAEQSYVEGLAFDKKSKERDARAAYVEALKRDPGFAPAHIALGLSLYRSGEYQAAAKHLEAALVRNKDAGDAHYYLALAQRALGQTSEAEDHLLWLVRAGYRESLARYVLGEIALARGDTKLALEHLQQAVMLDPRDLKARTVLAVAERLDGNVQSALTRIKEVVSELPIDYFALRELYLVSKAAARTEQQSRAGEQLRHLLSREPDAVLELAFDYVAIGRNREAIDVLEDAIKDGPSGTLAVDKSRIHPLLYYTLGYLYQTNGEHERAQRQFALGMKGDPAFVFPHRVEEISVLVAAVAANKNDGRALYYLGNVLAAKNRDNDALIAWREAVRLDPANTIAQRNYARALWQVSQNRDEAAAQYQRAINASPTDFRLYVEFDRLLAETSATERRIKLLEGAPAAVLRQSPVVQSLAAAYIDAGRFSEAAALLAKTTFTSGEGEDAALGLYRKAHLGLARKYRDAGDHAKAAAEFAAVTEFPRNFGVGRPAMQSQAQYYVAAAREYDAGGNTADAEHWWQRAANEELNPPSQPEEPWSENYYYKAVALDHVGRKADARKLYERLALLNDEQKMLEAEPWPASGAIRFVLAGAALKALGRTGEARIALERALKLDPQNELAISQLAELKRTANSTVGAAHRGRPLVRMKTALVRTGGHGGPPRQQR
jgi:tetratricopeptide (TPR) repeat protein